MPVAVEWFDDLGAAEEEAAGGLDRAAQPSLYDRIDWFRLTRRHIHPEARLAIARVRDGADSAWLFLIDRGRRHADPLASWYTLRFAPIFTGNGRKLLPMLANMVRARFDRLHLHPLADPMPLPGWRRFATPCSTHWTIDRPADFATYWAARPARLRHTVARRQRSHPLAIRLHRAFDAEAWAAYESVYAASWKPAEGSPAFLRALAEQEGEAGTLRLGIAQDGDGRAVAAQVWLVEQGVATIHKLAHREDARAGSPGSLLSHALFRAAIEEDGVQRLDFGLGDDGYKADWMDRAAPMWRIDAYRATSLSGLAGIARETASRLARRAR